MGPKWPPPPCTFWAWLGLSPGSPGTPVGWSLPCPSVLAPRPAPSSHLVYRGQLAPGHKDPLLTGDPVNMQEIKKPAARPGQTSSPHWGKGTRENGHPRPAHRQPPAQNGQSGFSGGICPSVAPSPLHTKHQGHQQPCRRSGGRERTVRKLCRPNTRGTKRPSRPPPELPALSPRPPEWRCGEAVPGAAPPHRGRAVSGELGQDSPLERWMQVCWLSLRKKPLRHWHS